MAVVSLTVGDNTMIVLIIRNLKNCHKRRRSPTTVASPFASLYATKNQLTDEFFLVVFNVGVNINMDVNIHDKRDSRSRVYFRGWIELTLTDFFIAHIVVFRKFPMF